VEGRGRDRGWKVVQLAALALAAAALVVALVGDGDADPATAADAPVTTSAPAGGDHGSFTPGLATIAPEGGAVQPTYTLNEAPQAATGDPESGGSWTRIGGEVVVNARLWFDTLDPGVGWLAIDCLPIPPVAAPRILGTGFLIHGDGTGALKQDVQVVLDPVYDTARPVLFVSATPDGLPADFVANEVLVSGTNPFPLGDGDLLNVTLMYEAADGAAPTEGC
jgi:hypothetical protein